jgi:hypothetical protein
MRARPCYRNLDRPIVALWDLEPRDLAVLLGATALLVILAGVVAGLAGGVLLGVGFKALKAGRPRGFVFALFYRSGLARFLPAPFRPPDLVPPPPVAGRRTILFSAVPGPEDDDTPESRYFRGRKEFLR